MPRGAPVGLEYLFVRRNQGEDALDSSEIRKTFIQFFEERGHTAVPGSSLVPDDPTLLLTNAGMVQFKPYFLGRENPPFGRATTVQKCLRTTDIESVGVTARHNTFFEMLGNFSFGDYYKESVIPWAWELVTGVFGIDPEALWMSVYEEDDEAADIWKSTPGVRPERVIRLGADDNFWDMGDMGPCGPCSEILYDRGEGFACGPECVAGCDCDRFLELWNLVFMQYDRQADRSLVPLPRKNIDTGMGLERVAALKQGVPTIFETDLIKPIVEAISALSGARLGDSPGSDVSIKVIADHARAATFLISDGVIPSNEGRGYVLRRLLRRAVRHGRLIGIEDVFIDGLADVVVELMHGAYPELAEHHRLVTGVIKAEEERFGQTLEQGIELLREVIEEHRASGSDTIEGKTVFYLHDTLGFPLEVTAEMAADEGMLIDRGGFEALMEEQRERARLSREHETQAGGRALADIGLEVGATGFEAYSCSKMESRVSALLVAGERVEAAEDLEDVEVILDATPFYAESGGQVGDTGRLVGPAGQVDVEDTYYGVPGLIVHRGRLTGKLAVGDRVDAEVDAARRLAISRNHSATHLLHWALRQVLGSHARQAGSLVTPERLRFDFTHFQAVTREELERIEELANARVIDDAPVTTVMTSREEAMESGAIALFGEKYSERVRVVGMGDFSRELCGGIHVERTGAIGPIRVIAESGIGAGLRRIEATTGFETLAHYRFLEKLSGRVAGLLKASVEQVPERLEAVLGRVRELEREAARESSRAVADTASRIVAGGSVQDIAGLRTVTARADGMAQKELRDLADVVMNKGDYGVVALAGEAGGKAQLVVKVGGAGLERGLNARVLAGAGGKALGGGGGGREDMAVAGGTLVEGLEEALERVTQAVREAVESVG